MRKATRKDCKAVYDLICDMENEALPLDEFTRIFNNQTADRRYYCLVEERDSKVIGVLNLRFEDQLHHSSRTAEIMELAVNAAYRNNGIGKELYARACELSRQNGCILIEVASNHVRERAHSFYMREGMEKTHFKLTMPL